MFSYNTDKNVAKNFKIIITVRNILKIYIKKLF